MRYEDIPSPRIWKSDAFSIHNKPINPVVANIDDMLEKYSQAFTPMAKRNLLADLEKCCTSWSPPHPRNFAVDALLDVVKRRLDHTGLVTHIYEKILCLSYSVTTGGFDINGHVKYQGKLDDEQDMQTRVRHMKAAINAAYSAVPLDSRNDNKTLKLFMAPEFFFRGRYGAYPPEIVSQIMPLLRKGNDGTGRSIFKDWLFVFGTAVSATIDARQHCFTCNSAEHLVFEPDPLNPGKTIAKCSKGAGHNVAEGIYGATIDNVALIQKGQESHLIAKEFISGIDFRNSGAGAYVRMKNSGSRSSQKPIATEGSRQSHFPSKFSDERMGGGVFNFDGVTFGMEICLDHAEKKLRNAVNLQVQLIPSAGMNIKFWRTINNGITFNVDGLRADGDVLVRSGPGTRPQKHNHPITGGAPGRIERFEPVIIPYT